MTQSNGKKLIFENLWTNLRIWLLIGKISKKRKMEGASKGRAPCAQWCTWKIGVVQRSRNSCARPCTQSNVCVGREWPFIVAPGVGPRDATDTLVFPDSGVTPACKSVRVPVCAPGETGKIVSFERSLTFISWFSKTARVESVDWVRGLHIAMHLPIEKSLEVEIFFNEFWHNF